MRHAILGVGGVGGLVGACLAKSGDDVTLVVRPEAASSYPATLQLESPFGNFTVQISHAARVPAVDVLWLTVKATQLNSALDSIPSDVAIGAIVPLLNGLDHLTQLRSKFGEQRVIPATIAVETERVAAGHIVHRSSFARLNVSSRGRNLLESTIDKLRLIGFDCNFVDDEPTLLWSKLVFLGPLAVTTSAHTKTIGGLRDDPKLWQELEACVREAGTVARAERASVDAERVLEFIKTLPGGMKSSMQKDIEQGKPPELDAIGGAIVRAAARHGVEIPITKELMRQLQV